MNIAILNDCHIGAIRASGTTPQTALALRRYALAKFVELVNQIMEQGSDLIINGDLFDSYQIPLSDALQVTETLQTFLKQGRKLYLLPGNHDLSKDSSKLSTFEFIGRILKRSGAVYQSEAGFLTEDVYAIPHRPNQDLFDYDLSQVPECKYLLLHCNWDNGFAKESDHSLNLSADVAKTLPVQHIIMGHEHSRAAHLKGKVVICGNQWPMSVSDCLDVQDKVFATLGPATVDFSVTWERSQFQQVDWQHVHELRDDALFVRITGFAEEAQASEVVDTVARLRKVSSAFVITSAVKITGSTQDLDISEALASVEEVKAFDVMAALKSKLAAEQVAVLESLK